MPSREDDKPFSVKDRRRFTEEGEPRDAAGEADRGAAGEPEGAAPRGAASAAAEAIHGGPSGPDPEKEPAPPGSPQPPPQIDFTTFVFSMGSSALMLLGDAPNPETGESMKNLPLAKETIDLLSMLQEKTKGNLTREEDHFLGSLLYDLRLRFVEASKG